ncbi:radical SAM protein [Novispirillum sp. DQ9]|uniref:radical SAM protein n=1 Tax=Novispirillum sp. DQ9 TaxID=3398612 RepID=UPI003C7ADF89
MPLRYDMPLFRPPSEGDNLIIQATLGCSFNRCSFCSMYRSKDYRARPVADVAADIAAAARVWPDAHRVFLADGDAMGLPTDTLLDLCARLRAAFPALQRISAYATPANLLKKTPEELAALKAARLSLVYVGIESGDPGVLRRITKGATAEGIVTAVTKAKAAGLKVSATVILGLGGESRWREHIAGTAAVLNACAPTYASTLQLFLQEERVEDFLDTWNRRADPGETFIPRDDAGILEELELLLESLAPPQPVIFRSNHASNALPLAGTLGKDRDRLLAAVRAARQGALAVRPRWRRGL